MPKRWTLAEMETRAQEIVISACEASYEKDLGMGVAIFAEGKKVIPGHIQGVVDLHPDWDGKAQQVLFIKVVREMAKQIKAEGILLVTEGFRSDDDGLFFSDEESQDAERVVWCRLERPTPAPCILWTANLVRGTGEATMVLKKKQDKGGAFAFFD